ncbi:GNAT family N-acetyltransferase (plasmid) [Rhizobium sp. 32-5/1]|uniref:GNAT family N-acetyltransferase n=1 Tax=Rhizobium sp. 32-5/1 TaxID=3019602 RepID=UPI00240DEB94|nr:GNAT family N-acetyltransferase [Rhizobium sp. 32-5/1]WEZ86298.1 GNAT family N-acetyltransferase [Rhizobium sp. 32-5/1]
MIRSHAKQIAELINARNALTKLYTADGVLKNAANFIFRLKKDAVVACIEVKHVQWYQAEILHLSVSEDLPQRQGYGRGLVKDALTKAKEMNCRIAQCSIRVGNEPSEGLFLSEGFMRTVSFRNARSGNDVTVYQYAIVPPGEVAEASA